MADLLEWKAEYCIGNDAIDAEHQKLFDIANDVFRTEASPKQIDFLRPLLYRLYEYMKYHFDHEEAFMIEINFRDIEYHKSKHSDIILEMNGILKSSHQVTDLAEKLSAMMVKWVLKHILEEDIKIKPSQR